MIKPLSSSLPAQGPILETEPPVSQVKPGTSPVTSDHAVGPGQGALFGFGPDKVVPEAGILTSFPLSNLAAVKTGPLHLRGFQLDGDALRGQWLGLRRIEDPQHGPGFEIVGFLSRGAADTYPKRFERLGASVQPLQLSAATPEARDGGGLLRRQGPIFTPQEAKALVVEEPGVHRASLVLEQPASLRGLFRLEVFGDDAEASSRLEKLVKDLGLGGLFAPPDPRATEKQLLLQKAWSSNKAAFAPLAVKPLSKVPLEVVKKALAEAGVTELPEPLRAAVGPGAQDLERRKYLAVAKEILAVEPRALFDFAGFEIRVLEGLVSPGERQEAWLAGQLLDAPPEHVAPLDAEEARVMGLLLILASQAPARALELVTAGPADWRLEEVKRRLEAEGVTTDVSSLRLAEVTPGFFTAVDPGLPDRMREAGARYLYRSVSHPQHVSDALERGLKSQVQRLLDGVIKPGAAISRDLDSGGAEAVFTRLVTQSGIGESSPGWISDVDGEMKYHLLIDLEATARLDWWGHTTDSYGAKYGLDDGNHGAAFASSLQAEFSPVNEVMFPVGVDARHLFGVACGNEADRAALLEHLRARGITELAGKPIEEAVIVSRSLIDAAA